MEFLGLDIWMEILSRLGVKDLIRSKSISKAFLNLISSDDFVRLHLNKSSFRAIHLNKLTYLYLKQHGETESCLRVIDINGQNNISSLKRHGDEVWTRFCGISYGSCNGLLCLWPIEGKNTKYGGGVLLWNPALREAEFIPIKRPQQTIYISWFGYDNDEYKLILGTASHIHLIRLYIDTYTWKSSHEINNKNYTHCEARGTLVHRTVHWPAYYNTEDHEHTIISYDLRNETAGRIAMPDGTAHKFQTFVMGQVDGCLSIMFTKQFNLELWVMKEYGVGESWTKLMNLPFHMMSTFRRCASMPYAVELDDPAQLSSPIYGKDFHIESLISPRSINPRCGD